MISFTWNSRNGTTVVPESRSVFAWGGREWERGGEELPGGIAKSVRTFKEGVSILSHLILAERLRSD